MTKEVEELGENTSPVTPQKSRSVICFVSKQDSLLVSPSYSRQLIKGTGAYSVENGLVSVTYSPKGSPFEVFTNTPNKRPCRRVGVEFNLSSVKCCLFTPDSPYSKYRKRTKKPLTQSEILKKLDLYPKATKGFKDVELTVERIEEWSRRVSRGKNQNQVMNQVSASDYAAAFEQDVDEENPWDWLHLFAYSMGGADGINPQVQGNLVAGTRTCNIAMKDFVETALKGIISDYQLVGVKLSIYADLLPFNGKYTHIATSICYKVVYGKKEVTVKFDPSEKIGSRSWKNEERSRIWLENILLGDENKENRKVENSVSSMSFLGKRKAILPLCRSGGKKQKLQAYRTS